MFQAFPPTLPYPNFNIMFSLDGNDAKLMTMMVMIVMMCERVLKGYCKLMRICAVGISMHK